MAKYIVSGLVYGEITTTVEAASPEEALRIAEPRHQPRLCRQCCGGNSSHQWVLSGLSDMIEDLAAEVEAVSDE